MERSVPTFRLWLMMVLEFAIWGAWLPLIWGYMGPDGLAFTEPQISWVGSAFAIASIVGIRPEWIMPVMSIGQVAEILTMSVLGGVLARLG